MFRRRYPKKEELELGESWSFSKGRHGSDPLIVRVNRGVAAAIGHPEYSHQVGVAVPLRAPDDHGFPGSEESEELAALEEMLVSRLCDDRQSIFVAALSTGGMREFVFYTSDPARTHASLEELAREVTSHQVQHIIQPDPRWRVYRRFA